MLKLGARVLQFFAALSSILKSSIHNSFDGLTKLFSNLAKFPCRCYFWKIS